MKSASATIQLQPLTPNDIPFAMKLKSIAGWNQLISDWKFLLNAGEGGNFKAIYNGQEAGTVTTLTYSNKFSWIGMVLVDPLFRGLGVGTALLKAAVKIAQQNGAVRLDATPQGNKLYDILGFNTERELVRVERRKSLTDLSRKCSAVTSSDLEEIVEVDATIFGARRESVLGYLFTSSPEYAYFVKRSRRISGYCFGRSGSSYEQIGPIIAESQEDAMNLLLNALAKSQDKPVIVDVFAENNEWLEVLRSLGFEVQRFFIRKHLGKLEHPGIPDKQFAIAGPELG